MKVSPNHAGRTIFTGEAKALMANAYHGRNGTNVNTAAAYGVVISLSSHHCIHAGMFSPVDKIKALSGKGGFLLSCLTKLAAPPSKSKMAVLYAVNRGLMTAEANRITASVRRI